MRILDIVRLRLRSLFRRPYADIELEAELHFHQEQLIAIGLAGALALNRLISSLLFGVQPTDTVTIAVVIATITAVSMAAGWLPAWRASRLDPNLVLRDE